jgi:PAS domain S-box-containing protein
MDPQHLVGCIPVASLVWRRDDYRILAVNDAFVADFGYDRAEALAMTIRQLVTDADWARAQAAIATPADDVTRWRLRRKSGELVAVDVRGADVADGQARLSTAVDSSHREARLFFEELETLAQSGGWSERLDEGVTHWSPGIFALLGLPPTEPPGVETFLPLVHPDDRGRLQAAIGRRRSGESLVPRTFRVRRASDGAERVIRSHARIVSVDHEGRPRRLAGVWRDVTDETAISEALRAAQARLGAILEAGVLGIVEWQDARIIDANDVFFQLTGYTRKDIDGGLETRLLSFPEHDASFARARKELEERGRSSPIAVEYRKKDGGRAPVIIGSALLPGERRGVAFIVDDRERREMVLRLGQADRLASMGAMAAAVAHELNNPLAYVMSNLTFIAETMAATTASSAELGPALSDARQGAERMRQIVRDLATFSRNDPLETAPVDAVAAVEQALALTANESRHRARIIKHLEPVPRLLGNETRLAQVLVNILINAAQSIAEGDVARHAITVSTRSDGARVRIEISDDGCGIPGDVLPRIFDPFFTTRGIGEGTGLGLSIALRLVTAMGGAIEVDSAVGRGSTFRLSFPVAAPASVAEAPRPAPPRRARVVIVDDEPMVGAALRRTLSREHDVTVLTSARELFALLAREPVDVIICDLMMPEMTGMDVHAELMAHFPSLAARTIFLTGGAFTPRARAFLAEVPNPRLDKPFDAEKLRQTIRALLPPPNQ